MVRSQDFLNARSYLGRPALGWRIKQAFPHTHWTVYGTQDGHNHLCIWKMWMGRCYDVLDVDLATETASP